MNILVKKQIHIDKALAAYKYAREQARARDGISGTPLFVVYSYGNPWVSLMDHAGQRLIEARNG